MKKTLLVVLVLMLVFSAFAACDMMKKAEEEVKSEVSSIASSVSSELEGKPSGSDSGIEITVDTPEPVKVGDEIKVNITIKNNGENAIVYTQGSSSMPYPEALKIEMSDGRLRAATPIAMTKDFQTTALNPGETKGYEVSFEVAQDTGIEAGTYSGKATLEYIDTGEIKIEENTDLSTMLETAEKSEFIADFTINVE